MCNCSLARTVTMVRSHASCVTYTRARRRTKPKREHHAADSTDCPLWDAYARPQRRPVPIAVVRVSSRCPRSEEHTSELQSHHDLVCRLLLEKKKDKKNKKDTASNKNIYRNNM